MRFVPHPTDPQCLLNIHEVLAGLRDPNRLVAASDLENRHIAADLLEAYAKRMTDDGR